MPYIKVSDRDKFKRVQRALRDVTITNAGELNYLLTMLGIKYVADHGECYQTYNDLMGAQTGSQMEIYRRYISIYEDCKITENGDL